MNSIIVGTRGSKLALAQTQLVADALRATDPTLEVHVEIITTKGDAVIDVPLSKIGDKGLFVKELEIALLNREIDMAVHSAKDLPSSLPAGLMLGAFMPRADALDALVLRQPPANADQAPLAMLPRGARVGTSSLRRISQLLHARPDLNLMDMRGNVDTRLNKLAEGQYDAIVLAMAGIQRLGMIDASIDNLPAPFHIECAPLYAVPLSTDTLLPAVAQGALAIECRAGDTDTLRRLSMINHHDTQLAVIAERAFLRRMEGGCQVPIAAFAHVDAGRINIAGLVASLDGKQMLRQTSSSDANAIAAEMLGNMLAEQMLANGARALLNTSRIHPQPDTTN